MMTSPNDLGLGRAYVAGELDLEGDIFDALRAAERLTEVKVDAAAIAGLLKMVGTGGLRPLALPKEEAVLRGRLHSKERDAQAIAHHYDVSNDFYRIVLGPTLTYSCALWHDENVGLEAAQAAKHDLVARKLDLQPGQRLLDIGCGWGSMAIHAAQHYGVRAVGVTISRRQAELGEQRVKEAGVDDLVEIRLQDYRDVDDGPYDAISSIGMFEHVGLEQLQRYFENSFALLRPGGRFLNHAIGRLPAGEASLRERLHLKRRHGRVTGFVDRYVFPDGELHEIGQVVSAIQSAGFEMRHVETLREHYALTLRAWVANLERDWDEALRHVSEGRARVWRLYMAGSALNFEANRLQVHQVLAVRPDAGRSGMTLPPHW